MIYKLLSNLFPLLHGAFETLWYYVFRRKVKIGPLSRIGRRIEWRLSPGCSFKSGKGLLIGNDVTIYSAKGGELILGDAVGIGNRSQIMCHKKITIGSGTISGPNILIYDHDHVYSAENGVNQRAFTEAPVFIGKNCWLGAGCIILKGVSIGDNCVIGAGSVVTKNIPAGSLAVGSPAKVVQKRN